MMDLWRKDWPWLYLPLKSIAVLGIAGSLALPVAGFVMTGTFCSWCLASNLAFILLSLLILKRLELQDSVEDEKEGPAYAVMFGGMLLMLSVPFWPRSTSCYELSYDDSKHLRAAVGSEIGEDTILVFTDPACGHCHATIPTFVKKAEAAGKKVVALWTPLIPASQSGEVAMYGTIAHWQGFGSSFMTKEHGPNGLQSTLKVAKEEFTADEKTLVSARGVVASNIRLFQALKAKGTPSFAQIKKGRICVDLDARNLLK